METPDFNKTATTFWGALAAAFWFGYGFLNYLSAKLRKRAEANNGVCETHGEVKMSDQPNTQVQNEEQKAEKLGIKETQELMNGIMAVGLFIVSRVKDGVQFEDLGAAIQKATQDSDFKKIVGDAIDKADQVPAEIKDLDLMEGFTLGQDCVNDVKAFAAALKK